MHVLSAVLSKKGLQVGAFSKVHTHRMTLPVQIHVGCITLAIASSRKWTRGQTTGDCVLIYSSARARRQHTDKVSWDVLEALINCYDCRALSVLTGDESLCQS